MSGGADALRPLARLGDFLPGPLRPCRKIGYPSAAAAETARALIVARDQARPDKKLPVASYRCPRCRRWHLTSQPQLGTESRTAQLTSQEQEG